jgi:hypothetical protein
MKYSENEIKLKRSIGFFPYYFMMHDICISKQQGESKICRV